MSDDKKLGVVVAETGPAADTSKPEMSLAEATQKGIQAAEEHTPGVFEQAARRAIEAPLMGWVKGGTRTWAGLKLEEEQFQDAEKRRAEDDDMKRLAKIPVEQGGAKMYTHPLTDSPEIPQAYVLLKYLTRGGGETGNEALCEIMVGLGDDPTELALQMVCPLCRERSKHDQDCQMMIRRNHRWFHLVPGMGPETFVFHDAMEGPKTYKSAGVIVESEVFTCPRCEWRCRIDKNNVRPE